MKCKYCLNDDDSAYPPTFIIYNTATKEIINVLCAVCASNIDKALTQSMRYLPNFLLEDDIPF